ncbi:Glutamine synthetase, partial [Geodia barretti]
HSFPGSLDWTVSDRYLSLPTDKTLATYISIDATGQNVRCKTGTLSCHPSSVSDLPQWSFDGSSTSQAQGHDSDVLLKPVNFYRDPFFLVCINLYN